MGFPMGYLDVGGGLGIDYDGSRTNFESSMNYSMEEYARDVVFNIREICTASHVPVPDIVSESGRAVVAPHSLLVVEVFERINKRESLGQQHQPEEKHKVVTDLEVMLKNKTKLGLLERFHDALQKKEEAFSLFNLGYLDLENRAAAEQLFWQICEQIAKERPEKRLSAGGAPRSFEASGRPVRLQFLRFPVPARSLGAQAALPHRPPAPPQRKTVRQRHPRRHHLRLRRQDQQLHRPAGRQGLRHSAPAQPEALLPRDFSQPAPIRTSWAICTTCSAA